MISRFLTSSIGRKWVVALSGLVLVAYVLGHLAGNLQIFLGPAQINKYAAMLHSMGPMLWVIRAFLLACFVVHIVFTIKLAQENRAARPQRYAKITPVKQRLATRIMAVSGLIVLCFVVFHILHFTTRTFHPELNIPDEHGHQNVYAMIIKGFHDPKAVAVYVLGMVLLCSHLSHGFSSVLQTLSINNRKQADILVRGGQILAWGICAGYLSIPLAVVTGFLTIK